MAGVTGVAADTLPKPPDSGWRRTMSFLISDSESWMKTIKLAPRYAVLHIKHVLNLHDSVM